MAIYLGGTKCNLVLGNSVCEIQLYSSTPIVSSIMLLSSDNYILKDLNGLYLIPKDAITIDGGTLLSSKDGYILKDKNDLYLIIEESE